MSPQDSFIDEDEDLCPLCVEEFDLYDKNFRPCPCGYQICQFCFNNIKNNINGLCPACRRPYDEKTIEWKVVTQEEIALFKANVQKNAKKKQEQRHKEAQKREVESMNRKHLSGLRVVQKNLVYVVGISPGIPEPEILSTLRGDKYFGQYGKIIKIVVSNKKQNDSGSGGQSLGVYVTFARKEDAAKCIAAVNGSTNGDRVLRAQLGTTKYCSAYLRNETCTNKNCMFLHEPGDNDDSYSRQDLSSINSVNQQRPFSSMVSGASSSKNFTYTQSLNSPTPQSQIMARESSIDGSDNGDGSALPLSASWANRGLPQRFRRDSHSTSGAISSPATSQALPPSAKAIEETVDEAQQPKSENSCPVSTENTKTVHINPTNYDLVLISLLKAIKTSSLSFPPPRPVGEADKNPLYPPLFDDRGGRKRRAMREQDDLLSHISKDFPDDLNPMPGLLEEEAQESGSLQLGGEPEDRETGREGVLTPNFHIQRQSSSQISNHPATSIGPFGPRLSQAFPKKMNNVNSMNGRALTPMQQQQLMLLKSGQQSEMIDPFPPGMGTQHIQHSALFQQQSNGRQASRYNFNSDAPSSSNSLKTSTNSKLMSQQASMMPSGNHTQQAGFYPSMQGPPPGLKSSSTPPTNGSMFSQNLGFNNSVSNTLLGGIQKENSGEMHRDMARGRGVTIGTQVHDTGKREFMFPSFLNQYPSTSSTPASAMASIYGPQTGSFHDFGQKQKKKGKKHRHVNTSSSGGGGLVDLADPSILQARMQQQQQNNVGVGQRLFGGQAQDDQLLPSLDDAPSSVDALVGDNMVEESGRTFDNISHDSKCFTPLVPPGFGLHQVNPSLQLREEQDAKYTSHVKPTSSSLTPRTEISNAGSQLTQATSPTGISRAPVINNSEVTLTQGKKELKSQRMKPLKSNSPQSSQIVLQSEDFPALEDGKSKDVSPSTTSKSVSSVSLSSVKKLPNPAPGQTKPPKASSERRITSNSDSSVAIKSRKPSTDIIDPSKQTAAFPPLPSTLPPVSTPITNAQIPRNIPKTLRLTTTKLENVSNASMTSSTMSSSLQPQIPLSRHPSLTTNARLEIPDTPTSEMISDNASITSTSFSRASSPPPSRVGSAPVRTTTKSSQKKYRQAQKERERGGIEAALKFEPEVEIAPIMGRKKKQKKERLHNSTSGHLSTSSQQRSPTPEPGHSAGDTSEITKKSSTNEKKPSNEIKESIPESVTVKNVEKAPDPKVKEGMQAYAKSDSNVSGSLKTEDSSSVRPPPTPASIFQKLVSSGIIKDPNELYLLKNISSSYRHNDLLEKSSRVEINPKLIITPEDHEALIAGKPVHKVSEAAHRIMLTPNGDCVRNLTEEEEKRYLDYQARLAKDAGPAAFVSSKHTGHNGFTMISGRAVPSGPPSYFPTPNKGNGLDAVSKIQRDEALNYINQYVLPTLSSNSQLDKAFNANSIQGDMIHTNSSVDTSWKSWGPSDQAPTQAGIAMNDFYMSQSPTSDGMIENITTHFTIGEISRQQPGVISNTLNSVADGSSASLLSLTDAESAMQLARKESDSLEKKLNALIKKNRRLLLGAGH